MKRRCAKRRPSGLQQGYSLMELLIATTAGLILLAGIERIYLVSGRSYATQQSIAAIQDSGRFAFVTLSAELRHAGYWRGRRDPASISGTLGAMIPDGSCLTGSNSWGRMLAWPIHGLDDDSSAYQCVSKSDFFIKNANMLGSDILTVRYASAQLISSYTADDDHRPFLRLAPFAGRLYLGGQHTLAENTDILGPATSDHRLIAHAYYIGHSHDGNGNKRSCPQGNRIPALIRISLDENGYPQREELVTGIEDLQFVYGIDTDADGSANQYVDADQITDSDGDGLPDWDKVTAVRFWLLARDECPEPGYQHQATYGLGNQAYTPQDGFRRQQFSSTIALRNRS